MNQGGAGGFEGPEAPEAPAFLSLFAGHRVHQAISPWVSGADKQKGLQRGCDVFDDQTVTVE